MQPSREEWLGRPGGLGERLWRLRKSARLTQNQLADLLGWRVRTKVTKIERGTQAPTEDDITAWAAACGRPEGAAELIDLLSEGQIRHHRYRGSGSHGEIQDGWDRLVRAAKRFRNFEVSMIPGLLQTPDYARYRELEAVHLKGYPADQVDAKVAKRMRRREVLWDQSREFEFIITEAALALLPCPPEVMAGQIDQLLSTIGLPNVTLAIIPFGVYLPVIPQHGFVILDGLTYVELQASEDELPPRESPDYEEAANGFLAEAVTGDEARRILLAAASWLQD